MIRTLPLPHGEHAVVDAADYERLAPHRWSRIGTPERHVARSVYLLREPGDRQGPRLKHVFVYLHREVMAAELAPDPSLECHHINGDAADNRRCNLAIMTHGDHRRLHIALAPPRSKSGLKGVYWSTHKGRWCAEIARADQGGKRRLGHWHVDDLEGALLARDQAAIALYGLGDCWLNRPEAFGLAPHPVSGDLRDAA